MALKNVMEIKEAIIALRRVISQLKKLSRDKIKTSSTEEDKEYYDYECFLETKNLRIIIGTLEWVLNNYNKNINECFSGLQGIGFVIDKAINKMKNKEPFNFDENI